MSLALSACLCRAYAHVYIYSLQIGANIILSLAGAKFSGPLIRYVS